MIKKMILGIAIFTLSLSLYINYADTETTIEQTTEVATDNATTDATKASLADFSDISNTHWGLGAIEWGLGRGIIGGFGNGRFAPDDALTEEQFAAILARFSSNLPETFDPITGKHWSEPYYKEILNYELPFRGYENSTIRNGAVNRGLVAMIVAAKYGFNLTEKQAVYFMYENGLSTGKSATERTFESYGARDPMTRTQALAFLMNMSNLEDKVMTFKGQPSIKGNADAETMLGVKGVYVDNKIVVDFADFNKDIVKPETPKLTELDKITSITTKVVDGKVVAVQGQKITSPTAIEGVAKPSLNYYTLVSGEHATVIAPKLNNSIINYKGTEFPMGVWFRTPEGMLKYDGKVVGIVQISLESSYSSSAGAFTDKTAFLSLMKNLISLGATQSQLDKAIPIINAWQDRNDGGQQYAEFVSNSKGTTLILSYGRGGVKLELYNVKLKVTDSTTYVD